MREHRCENCNWHEKRAEDGRGDCRVGPPVMVDKGSLGTVDHYYVATWPITRADQFCGRWTARKDA